MTAVILHRRFPCCGGAARFVAVADVYDRRCRNCGQVWTVRRSTRPASAFSRQLGMRFDCLEWERTT